MKFDKIVLANAFALATVILWVVCSIFVFLLPSLSMEITGWWMHGLDLSSLGSFQLTITNFLIGGITLTIAFWVIGYIFGWSWEKMNKK